MILDMVMRLGMVQISLLTASIERSLLSTELVECFLTTTVLLTIDDERVHAGTIECDNLCNLIMRVIPYRMLQTEKGVLERMVGSFRTSKDEEDNMMVPFFVRSVLFTAVGKSVDSKRKRAVP